VPGNLGEDDLLHQRRAAPAVVGGPPDAGPAVGRGLGLPLPSLRQRRAGVDVAPEDVQDVGTGGRGPRRGVRLEPRAALDPELGICGAVDEVQRTRMLTTVHIWGLW
jgi:hypothetical protein